MTLTNSFDPDKTKGRKECGKIPFYQQELLCESFMKVNKGENEKAQNYQNFFIAGPLNDILAKNLWLVESEMGEVKIKSWKNLLVERGQPTAPLMRIQVKPNHQYKPFFGLVRPDSVATSLVVGKRVGISTNFGGP